MKIVTKSNKRTILINKEEWLRIGETAGFIKTAKKTAYDIAMDKYLDKMRYINETLTQTDFDGTVKIDDDEILQLARKATGEDYTKRSISPDLAKSLIKLISDYLKSSLGLKKKFLSKVESPENMPSDVGEFELAEKLKKKEDEESPVDEAQVAEIKSDVEEGELEEKALEQDALELEKRQKLQKSKRRDIAGAVHPLDAFDEAVQVNPDGSATISDSNAIEIIKTVTGEDYSGVVLSPDMVQLIRSKIEEYFRPKVSEDTSEDDLEESSEESEVESTPSPPPDLLDVRPKIE